MLHPSSTLIGTFFQSFISLRFATNMTKANTSRNTKGSPGQRLGLKKFANEKTKIGQIIARQRGTKWHPGENVGLGRDHTIFALANGKVEFSKDKSRNRTYIHVRPLFTPGPRDFLLSPVAVDP
ncbi:hypothetical protein MDAP_002307 [Mitosporidium daphniae]